MEGGPKITTREEAIDSLRQNPDNRETLNAYRDSIEANTALYPKSLDVTLALTEIYREADLLREAIRCLEVAYEDAYNQYDDDACTKIDEKLQELGS